MSALAEKLAEKLKKETEHIFYIGEMKRLNGEFICLLDRIMNGEKDVAKSLELVKEYRKLRCSIAKLEKTDDEKMIYECGVFDGFFNTLIEIFFRIKESGVGENV